jgi:hypothetical protein
VQKHARIYGNRQNTVHISSHYIVTFVKLPDVFCVCAWSVCNMFCWCEWVCVIWIWDGVLSVHYLPQNAYWWRAQICPQVSTNASQSWSELAEKKNFTCVCVRVSNHPRTAEASGIFTTTGRLLFYNSWKENLKMHCSEFHEWLIHLNRKHGASYCPYSLVPDPDNFSNFMKLWGLHVLGCISWSLRVQGWQRPHNFKKFQGPVLNCRGGTHPGVAI